MICPPGNVWQCRETSVVVTAGVVPPASSGWVLLTVLQWRRQPPRRTVWPKISVMLRFERPRLSVEWSRPCLVCAFLPLPSSLLVLQHKGWRDLALWWLWGRSADLFHLKTTVTSSSLIWSHFFFSRKVSHGPVWLSYQESGPREMHVSPQSEIVHLPLTGTREN